MNAAASESEAVGLEIRHLPTAEKIESSRRENAGKLFLTDDEALAWASAHPKSKEPLYIVFGQNDPANPRHWATARKYYVTILVSMLNVITSVQSYMIHTFISTKLFQEPFVSGPYPQLGRV